MKANATIQTAILALLVEAGFPSSATAQEPPAPASPDGVAMGMPGMPGMPTPAPAATFTPTRVIRMRPSQKRPLLLKEEERNPYARRNPQEEVQTQEAVNAEELRIRERIGNMKVSGRSRGPNGLRVLLGDIILEEGRILPQLIEEQSEGLRVVELGEDTVVLGWIDVERGTPTGKTMQVAYDLSPVVAFALGAAEVSSDGVAQSRSMGTIRFDDDRKRSEPAVAKRPQGIDLPDAVVRAGQ